MNSARIQAAMEKSRTFIDALTIYSEENIPEAVVSDEHRFFSWDNEHRNPAEHPYLFDWSYYNGVIMQGLYDIAQQDPSAGAVYLDYIRRYLDAMIETAPDGSHHLNPRLAGYVDHHGADCYKTAYLLLAMSTGDDVYMEICRELYRDLTDETHVNSHGNIVPVEYSEAALGHNYWHSWAKGKSPKYKVWLDGIYMLQPFLSSFAARTGDRKQLALVQERLDWVADTLLAEDGLYCHAGNSKDDVCPYHWTRAMGWYGMAMVDVMEVLPAEYLPARKAALKTFVDGMVRVQKDSGLWTNVADWPETETNRLEVSGTSMMVYTILKGIRKGWLDPAYKDAAVQAFTAIVEQKLIGGHLTDIYLKASGNGKNNYELPEYYLTDEGKGVGPFIMAYSEMLYL